MKQKEKVILISIAALIVVSTIATISFIIIYKQTHPTKTSVPLTKKEKRKRDILKRKQAQETVHAQHIARQKRKKEQLALQRQQIKKKNTKTKETKKSYPYEQAWSFFNTQEPTPSSKASNNNESKQAFTPLFSQFIHKKPIQKVKKVDKTFGLFIAIDATTNGFGGKNIELLNDTQDADTYLLGQSIIDFSLQIATPTQETVKPVEFGFTGRMNTVLGNNGEIIKTEEEYIKIGRAITETPHNHTFNRPLLWAREAWLKVHSENFKHYAKVGLFEKRIGLGISLGNLYVDGNPLGNNPNIETVDQFRPGFEIHTTLSDHVQATGYIGIDKTIASSFALQAEHTQGQELTGDTAPYTRKQTHRHLLSNSFMASLEVPIQALNSDTKKVIFTPFVLYNRDPNHTVEFAADALSNLYTAGLAIHAESQKFEFDLEAGINFGSQEVRAWDRNIAEEHARLVNTHLFALSYDQIADPSVPFSELQATSGDWELSPIMPWPVEDDISIQHGAGVEFQDNNPSQTVNDFLIPASAGGDAINLNHTFKNSYSRFRKAYKNNYKGWMIAFDGAFHISKTIKIGFAGGLLSGGDNPNDSEGKILLHRLDDRWDTIRQDKDKDYSGFIGLQSLYQGKHVQSEFLQVAHKLNSPITQSSYITPPVMSNLAYGGLGITYHKNNGKYNIHINSNVLAYALPHQVTFGYDPTVQDIFTTYLLQDGAVNAERFNDRYDKKLSSFLGIEANLSCTVSMNDKLNFYASGAIFVPGSHYHDIKTYSYENKGKHVDLQHQLAALRKDVTGVDSEKLYNMRLLDNIAFMCRVGIEYKFDMDFPLFNTPRRKKYKHKKGSRL